MYIKKLNPVSQCPLEYEMPIRVEYSLTEKGKSAIPVLEGLCKWTALYRDEHDKDILHLCADCPIWK